MQKRGPLTGSGVADRSRVSMPWSPLSTTNGSPSISKQCAVMLGEEAP
jgi:hypothetical protein